MKKTIYLAALLLVFGTILSAAPGGAEKPRIGVLRFTNHTSAGFWSASVGNELSDMLVSELVSTKAFQVVDRKELDAVLSEQDLGESGRVSAATKAKMGNIKGAKYIVAATVSSYEESTSGGGGGISVGGISVGGKKDKTYIACDLKVVDTETGEIVDTRTIEAESSGIGLSGGVSIGAVSLNGGGFERTPAGKAIRACVIYLADYLECSLTKGENDRCMKKWDKMDEDRKARTRGSIDIK
jgi:curli biogenesis system outer membrane secretion channel CsgG